MINNESLCDSLLYFATTIQLGFIHIFSKGFKTGEFTIKKTVGIIIMTERCSSGLIKFNEKMEKMPKIAKSYTAKERSLVGFCVIF